MGYFRPIQSTNKPQSFTVASGVTFERGSFLWMDASGYATNLKANGVAPLGIADDDKTTSTTVHIIGQILSGSAAVVSGSGSSTIATGQTVPTTYQLSGVSASTTALKDWTLQVLVGGSWVTAFASGVVKNNAVFGGTGFTGFTASIGATGIITLVIQGSGFTSGTYSIQLTCDYVATKIQNGATLVSDMFSNDSTVASGLVTVWFMQGIYESDQYDPYVAYTVGSTLYANTDVTNSVSKLTTSSASSPTTVGVVVKVPAANYNAETKTTQGQAQPRPEVVRFIMNLNFVSLS